MNKIKIYYLFRFHNLFFKHFSIILYMIFKEKSLFSWLRNKVQLRFGSILDSSKYGIGIFIDFIHFYLEIYI